MKEFDGRVAVVTGAASGIGRALADRFAAAGMKLVLSDVEEAALARTQDELKAQGATTLAVRTDVSRADDVEALARATLDAYGAVHVVCNNAGVAGDYRPVWQQTLENWQWVLGVNLWGVIHGIRSFVPILLEQGGEGHVVNTASMAGLLSMPGGAAYHATKHAVVTISETLHFELEATGSPVRASVLCPGFVQTAILDSERNRPDALRVEEEISEGEQGLRDSLRKLVAEGIPPAQVAERVFDAIREERFYVFPHPEMLEVFRARSERMLAQENPRLALPDDIRISLNL